MLAWQRIKWVEIGRQGGRRARSFLLLAVVLAESVGVAAAQTPLGSEFQVNTIDLFTQTGPALAIDGGGRFVVIWNSELSDGSDFGIQGQRFDSEGQRLGGEFRVNSYVDKDQSNPSVAAHTDGRFVVSWTSGDFFGPDGSDKAVRAQLFDTEGKTVGNEIQVNTYTTGDQRWSAMAMDAAGRFVIVWSSEDQDGSEFGIHGQRFDASGQRLGGEFQVNTYTTGGQFTPAVAMDAAGRFLAVWTSTGQDGSSWGVFGQLYDSAGGPRGGEFQVNTYTPGDQFNAAVVAGGNGRFIVVWTDNGAEEEEIRGQRYDAEGLAVGEELRMPPPGWAGRVAADGAGNFALGWQDADQLRVQFFDSSGTARGGSFLVNASATSRRLSPALAMDETQFVVVWSDYEDVSTREIRGQRLCPVSGSGALCIFSDGFESGNVQAWSTSVN